ncbi:hypothetical protein [Brevundimonas sp. FT23042]|uniref:hypothetical protein n=1 Tax=Brevundimonas sp. FT23042 TaxID=3393749 RepID=UPI003B58A1E1
MTDTPIELFSRHEPLVLLWPAPSGPSVERVFTQAIEWRAFIEAMGLPSPIPAVTAAKFSRAQTLYLLAWLDPGLIKAGELAALVALELALRDRYGGAFKRKSRFSHLLKHMVEHDGLTDAVVPLVQRCGGTVVGQLTGETRPTLADRRNDLAHGDPFEGWPTGGLLELVRDLIAYAYRDYIAEGRSAERVQ